MRVHRIGLAALSAVCAVASSASAQDAPVALKALYIREMKPDAECKDTLNDTSFNFMFWPDAQANGLVMDQDDLPHVVQACGGSVTLSTKMLRALGGDAGMIAAIEAAHIRYAASPAGAEPTHGSGAGQGVPLKPIRRAKSDAPMHG